MTPKGTILIIEDNEDHLEMFLDAFEAEYEIISAENGEECLEIVAKRRCDLVILDYYLSSHFSGIEVLGKISQNYPDLPVIMVTAYGNEDLAVEAMKFGARDYIRKTLDNSYIERIREHVVDILAHRNEAVKAAPEIESHPAVLKEGKTVQSAQTQDTLDQILSYLEAHQENFFETWKRIILSLKKKLGVLESSSVDEKAMGWLFAAFLKDIQQQKSSDSILLLKKMIVQQEAEEKSLLAVELMNTAFRGAVRCMFEEDPPEGVADHCAFMIQVNAIVDQNHLELTREYEKIIASASSRARQSERLSTKAMLMTTLQHEIRQPLTYILNTTELLQVDRHGVGADMIDEMLTQTRRIETLLDHLERDSHMHARRYSADLTMIDMRKKEDKKPDV